MLIKEKLHNLVKSLALSLYCWLYKVYILYVKGRLKKAKKIRGFILADIVYFIRIANEAYALIGENTDEDDYYFHIFSL